MQPASVTTTSSRPPRPGRLTSLVVLVAWALALVLGAAALVFQPAVRAYTHPAAVDASLQLSDVVDFLFAPVLSTFGALIVLRSANRRYGWLMLAAGFSLAANGFAAQYHLYAFLVAPEAGLPLGPLAAWAYDLYMIPMGLFFCLPVLFPDGNLPSRRWRWVFWPTMAGWSIFASLFAFLERPASYAELYEKFGVIVPNPFGFIPHFDILMPIVRVLFVLLLPVSILTGLASLIARYRGAGGDVRQQIKWVVYFLGLWLVTSAVFYVDNFWLRPTPGIELERDKYVFAAQKLLLSGVGAALGISILKYRLYAIDLLINRTLVYGGLTAAIVLGYVFLVSGLGALLPDQVGLLPSLIATAVLAALFAPLKDRLQRGTNRLLFGQRKHPYEVMRTLGAQLEHAHGSGGVLPAIAETIAKSLKFPHVSITLKRADDFEIAAEHGSRRREAIDLPLYHQGNVIGTLSVCPRDGEQGMAEADGELLRQIALWLGPVAHSSLLAQELREAHARLVSARAEERRRLYRDLHDGLGPTLASQTFGFDRALEAMPDDPQSAIRIVRDMKEQAKGLVQEIRRLVYALRSSTLDELGLVGSLREVIAGFHGSANGLEITLDADEQALRHLPAAHEQAAERIALEGLTNAVRHSKADRCRLVLEIQEGPPRLLELAIEDNGRGLQAGYSPGVGMASMVKRAEALGGGVWFEPNRPQGTRVVARLPFSNTPPSSERG